ncbi:Uncharacterized protein OBRU01_17681 [Operophtera brumata]|uniref:Tick transposon n=1 Tax=Operophtera brumata TaxID=104452 RepID=A0A0L7KTG7_OPEBR|nr:Uncharacterized protein OBRU01_17681 [Operophtera brumata]
MMFDLMEIVTDIDNVNVSKSCQLDDPENCKQHLLPLQNSVSIISLNIRSINKKFDDFTVLLNRIKFNFDLLILTECRLNEDISPPILTNYVHYYTKNLTNQNDGVVAFVRNTLTNVTVSEPTFSEGSCLLINIGNDICVIAIYRSPSFSNSTKFLNSLDNVLTSNRSYANIILVGDINIDILTNSMDRHQEEYLTLLASHGLLPGHLFNTREYKCLDHCKIKTKNKATTLVLPATITDHSPVLLQLITKRSINTQLFRTHHKTHFTAVCQELSQINWNITIDFTALEAATEIFLNTVAKIILKHTKTLKLARSKTNLKPWITPGLIKCMRRRDKLHIKLRKNPNNDNIINYRNLCNKILKKLKRTYEKSELQKNNKNSKETWKVIKRICNFPLKANPVDKLIKKEQNVCNALNKINEYFVNVGSNLAHDSLQSLGSTENDLANQCIELLAGDSNCVRLGSDLGPQVYCNSLVMM